MKYASVCSGVEAATLAWEPLGWEPLWFSEIEAFPCEVLRLRYPNVPNLGDMTKIKGENYRGMVELLVGGTPCQGFSVAGQQGGLDDERSQLCLTFVDLLNSMRPKWFVWENVPGVFSTNKGRDFEAFLQAANDIGYGCAWRVLDAQYVRVDGYPRAVPQRRRRVFVIGHIGDDIESAAKVLFEPGCLQRATPPCRVKGKGFAGIAERSIGNASGNGCVNFASSSFGNYSETEFGGTHESSGGDLAGGSENLSVFWNGNDFAETLKANCNSDRMPDKGKVNCVICLNDQGGSVMQIEENGNAGTLRANTHGNEQIVAEFLGTLRSNAGDNQHAIAIAENVIGRKVENGGNGIGVQEELAYTQNATGVMGISINTTVRRLLPIECERLMGFPDNYTRIPWKGKPAEECPDSPRYKACGNSMCVNVMRWIGMRVDLVEKGLI